MDNDETINYTYVGKFEMIIERIIGAQGGRMPDPLPPLALHRQNVITNFLPLWRPLTGLRSL